MAAVTTSLPRSAAAQWQLLKHAHCAGLFNRDPCANHWKATRVALLVCSEPERNLSRIFCATRLFAPHACGRTPAPCTCLQLLPTCRSALASLRKPSETMQHQRSIPGRQPGVLHPRDGRGLNGVLKQACSRQAACAGSRYPGLLQLFKPTWSPQPQEQLRITPGCITPLGREPRCFRPAGRHCTSPVGTAAPRRAALCNRTAAAWVYASQPSCDASIAAAVRRVLVRACHALEAGGAGSCWCRTAGGLQAAAAALRTPQGLIRTDSAEPAARLEAFTCGGVMAVAGAVTRAVEAAASVAAAALRSAPQQRAPPSASRGPLRLRIHSLQPCYSFCDLGSHKRLL